MENKVLSLLVGLALCLPAAVAQENPKDDPFLELREYLGFATWPGKGGAMKKGVSFTAVDCPALSGWSMLTDKLNLRYLAYGMVRELHMAKGDSRLALTFVVAHTSTDNGHELLLRLGDPKTNIALSFVCKRGDTAGLAIGDVNIVSASNPIREVAFVRNNIACILRNDDGTIDVKSLAEQIDARIRALPNLTAVEFEASRPEITTFEPAKPSIKLIGDVTDDESTVLNVVAADPASEPLKKAFEDYGNLRIDGTVAPPVVGPGGKAGAFPLKLIVINQSLQYKEATTTITVENETPGK